MIETWDLVYKWVMFSTLVIIPGILVFMAEDKSDDFLDVPDFIKGDERDFYGY